MTDKLQIDTITPGNFHPGMALRLSLGSGLFSVPIHRVYHLAGYATLTGDPDDYFQGWLTFRGNPVPVFDLNRIVCDQPTPEHFGSRILLIKVAPESLTAYLGLLAGGITDTIAAETASEAPSAEMLDLDSYLPMLYTLIPPLPTATTKKP